MVGGWRIEGWRAAAWVAWGACAALLVRFAVDFSGEYALLAVPFCGLVVAALGLGAANLRAPAGDGPGRALRWGLAAAVPLAFLAASLGCMGLAVEGCSPFCTFVKLVWIPLLAGAAAAAASGRRWALVALPVAALVPLAPHCVCYNAANAWWIDLIGVSPTCYTWGAMVTVVAASSLGTGARPVVSLLLSGAVVGGALAFFVGHHYFHFPW
jgi:hypothetical protein